MKTTIIAFVSGLAGFTVGTVAGIHIMKVTLKKQVNKLVYSKEGTEFVTSVLGDIRESAYGNMSKEKLTEHTMKKVTDFVESE